MAPDPHPHTTFRDILVPRQRVASQSLLDDRRLELTYNGRGALLRACSAIASRGRRAILLPAYHCPSGISPAIQAGLQPVFYRVRRDLSIDFDDLKAKTNASTAAVLVIHYFGVATDLRPLQAMQERGIELIEDWSHSFLQGTPVRLSGADIADYRIYSFWKLAPTFVGGGLWRRSDGVDNNQTPMAAAPVRERMVRLKRMLETALSHSDYRRAKAIFCGLEAVRGVARRVVGDGGAKPEQEPASGESHYPFDLTLATCRMPALARRILEACDLASLAQKRRDNFDLYARLLTNTDQLTVLYPDRPAGTCPWVYPVLLKERDQVDHRWRDLGVALHTFGIHLHSALFRNTDALTVADAKYLSENVLCLAVHQDLSLEHIENSALTINRYLEASGANA